MSHHPPLTSRRRVLQSAGVLLALPWFESLSQRLIGAPAGVRPKRMVCVGNMLGFYQPAFFPTKTGRDYELPELLKPLAPHRRDMTFFSGLDHGHKGGHFAIHSYLSGVRTMDAKGMPEGNITIDQRAAETINGATRFPSLTIGSETGIHGGCLMSWTRGGTRVPPITGPHELFRKLFINDSAGDLAQTTDRLQLQGSILDAVRGDARSLQRELDKRDQEKLDEFFTSVRDVEKQLELGRQWQKVPKPAPGMPEPRDTNFVSDLPVIYDLIALALQTDSTRIATLEIGGSFDSRVFDLRKDYHALSHHGQVQENIDGLLKLEGYQTQQFARFIDRLKGIADGDGTLLDHSMVLFGSGMANANAHTNLNLPIILAGGGFQHGEHRAYPMNGLNKQPLCNLYVTMLQRFGLEVDKFGIGKGTLAGLA